MTRAQGKRLVLLAAAALTPAALVAAIALAGPPGTWTQWSAAAWRGAIVFLAARVWLFSAPLLAAAVRADASSVLRRLLAALAPALGGGAALLAAALLVSPGLLVPLLACALVCAGWSALAAGGALALARVWSAPVARALVAALLLAGASLPFATGRALRETDPTRLHGTRRAAIRLAARGSAWMSATRAWELARGRAARPSPPHLDGYLYDRWAGNDWPVPYPAWPLAALVPLALGAALAALSLLGRRCEEEAAPAGTAADGGGEA